jgi:CheY-like chemotaxis protein
VLTALVVDAHVESRRRMSGLLRLGGWEALEAAGTTDALRQADLADPDLVVADAMIPGQGGAALLRRLRAGGSRARFVMVAADPGDDVRAEAAAAGALACLSQPVDARILLDFLRRRTTGPTAQDLTIQDVPIQGLPIQGLPIQEVDDLDEDYLDAELRDRLQVMYAEALPGRLSAIARSTTAGDTTAVASAAHTLAGTSGQLGHPDVAEICLAIAADARRGVLAHGRLVQLRQLAAV